MVSLDKKVIKADGDGGMNNRYLGKTGLAVSELFVTYPYDLDAEAERSKGRF
jgi:hypothetical protein